MVAVGLGLHADDGVSGEEDGHDGEEHPALPAVTDESTEHQDDGER